MPRFMFGSAVTSPSVEDSDSSGIAISFFEGDPWEGCEDIAGQDLSEFFNHQLRLNFRCSLRSSNQDASSAATRLGIQEASCTTRRFRPQNSGCKTHNLGSLLPLTPVSAHRLCRDERPSVGSLSVASTSASISGLSTSSDLSSAGSEWNSPSSGRHSSSPGTPAKDATDSRFARSRVEPLAEEQDSEDAWQAACSQWDKRGLKQFEWFKN